jgi:Ca2+-binding EF-hand superfamily protein
LKSTFKKLDQNTKGYLSLQEFKDMLKQFNIEIDSEEIYQMLAEYDPHIKGVFCYDIFIKKLIEKSF